MDDFDYIIAGGGAAGLSLAYQLSQSKLRYSRILIIDRDRKNQNDRTWGFWHRHPVAFHHLASLRYNKLDFFGPQFTGRIPMGDYRYSVIRGIDFYEFVQKHLITHPNVEFIQASISDYRETTDGATVHTDSGDYTARWIFTSIMDKNTIREATASSIYLKQHFKGFVIETKEPTFDPDAFTMFDFRTPQNGLMRFFYVLPQSETRALVEYTLFSEDLLEKPAYDQAIAEYIRHVLNIKDYRVVDEEFGIIPMTTYRFPVLRSPHVVNIGSVAGSSKPSSGYTFTRIQKHVREIVSALESGRSPVVDANSPARYRFYDAVLLNILKNRGGQGADIFSQLFKNNPVGNIFRFLDETGGLKNDLKVLLSLPPWPFLKSAVQLLRNRQDKNSF